MTKITVKDYVDYAIWGALQEKVYLRRKFTTVEQLKLAIIDEWRNLGQRYIDSSIKNGIDA